MKSTGGKAFFDTNVLVYALVQNDPRSLLAAELIAGGGTISVQVLNEFVDVVRRKARMPWDDVSFAIDNITALCSDPLPITLTAHKEGLRIAEKYGYRIYDALIVASAMEAKCDTLYSEDMQHGQVIEKKLTIKNPFRNN